MTLNIKENMKINQLHFANNNNLKIANEAKDKQLGFTQYTSQNYLINRPNLIYKILIKKISKVLLSIDYTQIIKKAIKGLLINLIELKNYLNFGKIFLSVKSEIVNGISTPPI